MTIKPFLSIISKDLKIFFRNTPSALTILIAPLLIILLAGLSFNSSALSGLTISTQDIDKTITLLKDAKSKVNDSTAISKIDDSITLLNSVKEESDLASDNLADAQSSNSQATKDLKQISKELENLITNLNTQKISEADSIVSPIKIKIESIKLDSTNRDYLIPTILALIALFGAILLSSTFVLKEKKTKAYFRNFITPTKDLTFIMATYVTCLIILTIQFLLVFVGIKYILKMNLIFLPLEIISILFLTLTTFIFIGMFIGYIFKSEETTIFAAVLTSAILMFFSNVIIPIENIAGSLRKIVEFNPVVLSDIALKKVLLFNFTFDSLKIEIIGLASIFTFFLILTYFARKITKRKL